MFDKAKRISTLLIIRGLLTLAFGVLVLALPEEQVAKSLIWVFGIFAFVEGIFACIGAVVGSNTFEDWLLLLLAGVLSVIIGVFALTHPALAALGIVLYIAVRALIYGVMEIAFAIRIRKEVEGEWLYILSGIVSILFGLVLLRYPVAGIVAVVWLIGVYAIVTGAMELVLAGQVHNWVKVIDEKRKALSGRVA